MEPFLFIVYILLFHSGGFWLKILSSCLDISFYDGLITYELDMLPTQVPNYFNSTFINHYCV
jgi:hypothetical protein